MFVFVVLALAAFRPMINVVDVEHLTTVLSGSAVQNTYMIILAVT